MTFYVTTYICCHLQTYKISLCTASRK